MEYLVTMTTHVPAGTSNEAVAEVRTQEAGHSRNLAERGALLRLWRPPVEPGEWRTFGLFDADNDEELEKVLASMPLRIWRSDDVTPLSPHPNDPAPTRRRSRGSLREFFTIFTIQIPADAATATLDDITSREAVRAAELAGDVRSRGFGYCRSRPARPACWGCGGLSASSRCRRFSTRCRCRVG